MDRNLHTDDFERLLREKSDEFRMYPSKRIWYSVYNNIHPGRKWPSVAMSIMLITSLLLIGFLNTNTLHTTSTGSIAVNGNRPHIASTEYSFLPFKPYVADIQGTGNITLNPFNKPALGSVDLQGPGTIIYANTNAGQPFFNIRGVTGNDPLLLGNTLSTNSNRIIAQQTERKNLKDADLNDLNQTFIDVSDNIIVSIKEDNVQFSNRLPKPSVVEITSGNIKPFANTDLNKLATDSKMENLPVKIVASTETTSKNIISKEDKEWIENYALYNRPLPRKWAGKLAWEMYVTPSVVFRRLSNDPNFGVTSNTSLIVIPANNREINNEVIQKPSAGLEVGAGFQYPVFKSVRLKGGLQLNFTRYNALAFNNTHPVATKLTMHDYSTHSTYEVFKTTPYSNKTGLDAIKLHNETLQISLPIGFDIKLLGNENIQWNVGVTMQPTYVLSGKSYLISADRRNYVKEAGMLNKWNLNAGFETFITYKKNGITYEVGPQLRSQLFTTNNKKFAVEEKLVNYGVRFGVVKTIK